MDIGFIGLGKMGEKMVKRLLKNKINVVAYDVNSAKTAKLKHEGAIFSRSVRELASKLSTPRKIWVMLPSGESTNKTLSNLLDILNAGDIVVDGSNSFYKNTISFHEKFLNKGVFLLDVGVSGGIYGYEKGYCIMVGGDKRAFENFEGIFRILSTENGYLYVGKAGSGHFVKMIHNAIEYAMMEAITEGIDLLKNGPFKELNPKNILKLWNQNSIIQSFLVEMARKALEREENLNDISPYVEDTGEGRWAVQTAIENKIPVPAIADSLFMRFISQREGNNLSFKVLALMRNEFGGHGVKKKK